MESVLNELDCNIKSSCITCKSSHHYIMDDVSSTIHALKPYNADMIEDVSSDFCSFDFIVQYYAATWCVSPRDMLLSTLVPIPQTGKK